MFNTVTEYLIRERFDRALHDLKKALSNAGLTISGELDISKRMKQQLGLGFGPHTVLLVDSPYLLLEAVAVNSSAATVLPLHVVVLGRGATTRIYWNDPTAADSPLPVTLATPLRKLQRELVHALDQIALRQDSYQNV